MAHTLTIGCITDTLSGSYNGVALDAIAEEAAQLAVRLIVYHGIPSQLTAAKLARDLVDGWICLPPSTGLNDLLAWKRPVILVSERPPEGAHCSAVVSDNGSGIRSVVRHLVDHGHTRIAFAGFFAVADFQERYDAYLGALQECSIPPDPTLVIQTGGYDPAYAEQAIQEFFRSGQTCTAIVAADDDHAIGLLRGLRAHGLNVPDDVAVVGFDDIDDAQTTNPPLTTVRQRVDELGRTALRMLIAEIQGVIRPGQITMTPTTLVTRRSCGCQMATRSRLNDPAEYDTPDWEDRLAHELVRQALFPQTPDETLAPARIWPGVSTFVTGLRAALDDSPFPEASLRDAAWDDAGRLTSRLLPLHNVVHTLRDAGLWRGRNDPAALARVMEYNDLINGEMLLRYQNRIMRQSHFQEAQTQTNQEITLRLLNHHPGDAWDLGWMSQSEIHWGCLALWDRSSATPNTLIIAGGYAAAGDAPLIGQRYAASQFPPSAALAHAGDQRAPIGMKVLPIRTASRDYGLLALVGSFAHSVYDGSVMWAALLAEALERDDLTVMLAERQRDMREAYEQTRLLAETVRDLGCPILTPRAGVVLAPLIGAIDSRRALQITETVLESVVRLRADDVLLDISGVPVVDTQVAATLIALARSVRLLGSSVAIIGIRPEIAQSIVSLGIGMREFACYASLEAALRAIGRAL